MKKIEDVPEKDVERMLSYTEAVSRLTTSRTALRIAQGIARNTLLSGDCRLSHKEFERRTGACRRTLQRAIRQLLDRNIIRRTGCTEAGLAVYVAVWERGDEYSAWGKAFDRSWEHSRKTQTISRFKAPAYPVVGATNGAT